MSGIGTHILNHVKKILVGNKNGLIFRNFTKFPKKTVTMSSSVDDAIMYPNIEPFYKGTLQVSDIHTLYYEQCGNADGIPVLFLHGGPGSGTGPRDRRYFDPVAYHIILFHQRGAGDSTPAFCLEDNTTWALVEDIEKLREKVGVNRWLIFGGSWGSTLALAYAEMHIDRVLGLIVRGIFTCRKAEQDWVYNATGAAMIYPEQYAAFVDAIPDNERTDIVSAYHKRVTTGSEKEQQRYAAIWNAWELVLSTLRADKETLEKVEDPHWNLAHARMECHYFINNGFLEKNQLLDKAEIIEKSGIPVEIVQGQYDLCCPMKTAWDLHRRIKQSRLHILPMAGHSGKEEGTGMTEKLIEITDKFKTVLKK